MKELRLKKILARHRLWLSDPAQGERANFGGENLRGADLRGANLNRAYLDYADLTVANLIGADLRNADLDGAKFRGTNLHGAIGIVYLDMADPRGYTPVAVAHPHGWHIFSGCRSFGLGVASHHWGESYGGDREIGDLYLRALESLPECPKVEAKS